MLDLDVILTLGGFCIGLFVLATLIALPWMVLNAINKQLVVLRSIDNNLQFIASQQPQAVQVE
jgi:hypothetical protein